ncbi:MAG: photosystem II assembly family protein [Microcystaceae cyanobacterium]
MLSGQGDTELLGNLALQVGVVALMVWLFRREQS